MDQSSPKVIQAQEFQLVDANGKLLASLKSSATRNNEPSLTLYDDHHRGLLVLEIINGRPRVQLYATSGQPMAGFGLDEKGGSGLGLGRENGTLGFFVEVPADGDAVRYEFDSQGQPLKR